MFRRDTTGTAIRALILLATMAAVGESFLIRMPDAEAATTSTYYDDSEDACNCSRCPSPGEDE